MAKLYYILSVLLLVQNILCSMNVTIGDIENNNLIDFGSTGSSGSTITELICPANHNSCVGRGDPDYIVPKSSGKEKIDGVFSDITTLEGYENNKKHAIVEACDIKQFEDKKCQTRKCAVNEDCLSELCQNGSCITNPENRLLECEKIDDENLICKRYLQEQCVSDRDCAGRCKNFICTYRHLNKLNTSPWVYYSTGIVTTICLILLFCCCLCCPGIFRWEVKEKRNNNPPPVVV